MIYCMLKLYTFITYYCLNYPAVQSFCLCPIGQTSRKLNIRIVLLTFEVIVGQTKRWAYEKIYLVSSFSSGINCCYVPGTRF